MFNKSIIFTEQEAVILKRAADLFEDDPKKFTKGTYARDALGSPVHPCSPSASCWCTSGMLDRCIFSLNSSEYISYPNLLNKLNAFVGAPTPDWNDHPNTTVKEVISILRDAANNTKEKKWYNWFLS